MSNFEPHKTQKIFFITGSFLPKRVANVANTVRMAEAMASHNVSINLIARVEPEYSRTKSIWTPIESFFGVKKNSFNLSCAPSNPVAYTFYTLIQVLKNKPCLIYTRSLWFASLLSFLRFKVFYHAHSEISPGFPLAMIKKMLVTQKKIMIFCVSEGMKRLYMDEYGVSENRLRVIRNGVPIDKFNIEENIEKLRSKFSINRSSFVCLYSGSLYPGRGIELIKNVATRLPDITFVIVGGSNEDIERESHLSPENMLYVGSKPYLDVPKYLKASDLLLMPYQRSVGLPDGGSHRSSILGPLKMYEYLASGTAMIASDLSSLREVLCENTAVFADPDNAQDWVNKIEWLQYNPHRRLEIGKEARRVSVNYDIRDRAKEILVEMEIYQKNITS